MTHKAIDNKILTLSKPYVPSTSIKAALRLLQEGYVAEGEFVRSFEMELSRLTAPQVTTVGAGTTALMMLLLAIRKNYKRNEVIIPAYGCTSIFYAVRAAGLKPILVDVDPLTFSFDRGHLKKRLSKKTLATVIVHTFGFFNGDVYEDLPYPIEDCAHSVGCTKDGQAIGTFTEAAFFSFYATKYIHTIYGGAVRAGQGVTDKIRDMKITDSVTKKTPWGFNVAMSNLYALIGLAQLGEIKEIVAKRRRIAKAYDRSLSGSPSFVPRDYNSDACYRYIVRLTAATIEETAARFYNQGIHAGRPYKNPIFMLDKGENYPGARQIYDETLALPLHLCLTRTDVQRVINAIRSILSGS